MTVLFSNAQDSLSIDNSLAFNSSLIHKTSLYQDDFSKVNLRMSSSRSNKYVDRDERKATFAGIFIAGLAFTTASILEGGYQYGTYVSTPGNPNSSTYVTPPFWKQTPRQIMFCIGVGFTLTGGFGLLSSNR